jgi:hypothetical protein
VSSLIYYYAACHYAECRYSECRYAECHSAECHYVERRGAAKNAFKTYSNFGISDVMQIFRMLSDQDMVVPC